MALTRREFLQHSAGLAGLLASGCGRGAAEKRKPLLVNHIGFTPNAPKSCLLLDQQPLPFIVIDVKSGTAVHKGLMKPRPGDLGNYLAGDFDELRTPGQFRIETQVAQSAPFSITPGVYNPALQKHLSYFASQRCGGSKTGHHAPCHLDDGRRSDNHKHQDVTGGWHDACDLRKWVAATIYGMIGLYRTLDSAATGFDAAQVIDELRWGNRYFLNMQEPAGYVMDYCGGDDGNRYTNNTVGDEDDRLIHVEPCELPVQFHFIAAQSAMARLTRAEDPRYARRCADAARRCLNWCTKNRSPGAALSLSAAVLACIEMHRDTADDKLSDRAAGFLKKLAELQVVTTPDRESPRGFFLTAADKKEPLREITHGNLPLLALCEALEHFPSHADARSWRETLRLHCNYLISMSDRSAFGTIPYGLYTRQDPGGNRQIGGYWYRWFMRTQDETPTADWWVGVNAHLASHGIGLVRAGRLLNDPRLAVLAQRQLDWILGLNPFDASTITGVGRNQPKLYTTNAFSPPTPEIPGGVMNGIGGDRHDEPALDPGSWNTCEYWTPMVGYTMWLMAELQRAGA